MGMEQLRSYRVTCDHRWCGEQMPGNEHHRWWGVECSEAGTMALQKFASMKAIDADWMTRNGRWLCPDHWTLDDDDEPVEVGADAPQAHAGKVRVDPVVVTCAVRYALGRSSYMPGLIADEVRRCWNNLGDQRDVIREDVRRWLADDLPASWMIDRETWEILDRWMAER